MWIKVKHYLKSKKISDGKKSSFYNIVATVSGLLALFFCGCAIGVQSWLKDDLTWSAGLWFVCNNKKCLNYLHYPGKKNNMFRFHLYILSLNSY